MRLLLCSRNIHNNGGIPRCVTELARQLYLKHNIYFLTSNLKGDTEKFGKVVYKPLMKKPHFMERFQNAYTTKNYSYKLKKSLDLDIIHSNSVESFNCDVVTMHSCHKAWVNHYPRGFSINPADYVMLSIEKYVLEKGSKKIISVAKGVKKEILENYNVPEDKITVIANGVNTEEFKPNIQVKNEIRKKYNIKKEVVLMFSGHYWQRKGLEHIIKALPKLNNVKLLVVGTGNIQRYKKIAHDENVLNKIIFTGFVQSIKDYYNAADCFVFPTLYEAFSLATLEAVSSGLPIIATKVNGTEDLIENGVNGFFIKRDSKDIAEKINILIEDEKLRKKMSRNARKSAKNYSWDKVASKTEKIYEEVINT